MSRHSTDLRVEVLDQPERIFDMIEQEQRPAVWQDKSRGGAKPPAKKTKLSRRALENGFSTISVLLLMIVFFAGTGFLIFFPRSDKSEIEKRTLETFPTFSFGSYFSGDFTSGVTKWYDDTVPYRDSLKNAGNNIKLLFGIQSDDTAVVIGKPIKKTDKSSASSKKPADTSSKANDTSADEDEPVQKDFREENAEGDYENGMLIINQNGHWRGLELFGGGSGDSYVSSLNTLREKLDSKINIYSMPAPLASEFYTPANFSDYSASQKECFNNIASRLSEGITSVDITSVLAKHTEENIYCRTDHHWQPLGAYYAAQTFAKAAGVPFADISKYKKVDTDGFVGTLYAFSSDSRLLNDPETFTYYEPLNEYSTYYYDSDFKYIYSGSLLVNVDTANSYLRFMGGDDQVVKVKTDVNNGRKLLVIKDSYGNAEIPFYTSSFEEIYVVDMRYFKRNLVNFINTNGITDVLFTMAAFSEVGVNADNIENLITQDADSKIVDEQLSVKED